MLIASLVCVQRVQRRLRDTEDTQSREKEKNMQEQARLNERIQVLNTKNAQMKAELLQVRVFSLSRATPCTVS